MARTVTSPRQFADWFNRVVPGVYRQMTVDDVRDMTTSGLIGRYGYYIHLDIETVRAVLRFEQLRQDRHKRDEIKDDDGVVHCRRCGVALSKTDDKRGRPREYCPDCESSRSTMRSRKYRRRMKAASN